MDSIKCKNNFGDIVEIPKEKFFFRPSVYGFLIQENKILTLTGKSDKKLWFPGGGVEVGEKMDEALKREFKEETGFDVKIKDMILFKENFFYYQPLDEAYHAYLFFFSCELEGGELLPDDKVDDLEAEKPRWIEINSLNKNDFSDLNEEIFQTIKLL
jgi:8-oxo-dGTP diphosphatase